MKYLVAFLGGAAAWFLTYALLIVGIASATGGLHPSGGPYIFALLVSIGVGKGINNLIKNQFKSE